MALILILVLSFVLFIVIFIIKKLKTRSLWIFVPLITIVIGFLLSFHILPGYTIVPKEHLSFDKTFITEKDISNLVKRYNNASWVERQTIEQESLTKKLIETGFIVRE